MGLDVFHLFLVFIAFSPVLTAVVTENTSICSLNEFPCHDGACVNNALLCDGRADCWDGSDEQFCLNGLQNNWLPNNQITVLSRSKRQASKCRKNQWQCRDGNCIGFDGKCDGIVDCPDGSDETFPLCRNTQCPSIWFQCTYGACVDGTAGCNGIQECADNSDELQPKCRNETDEVQGQFRCQNGQLISSGNRCDGTPDCSDGSDETVRACAGRKCPSYLFQCAYGACVDQGSDCNGKTECADGSDESDELCDRIGTGSTTTTTNKPSQTGSCVLPSYPDHGVYVVAGAPYASPGQTFDVVSINVTCTPGYGVIGKSTLFCYNGVWSDDFPKCVRFCRLNSHPSVEYKCLVTGGNSLQGTRECNEYEPIGTIVKPDCRVPNYYFSGVLRYMHCIEGSWDYVAICSPGLTKNGTNVTILVKDKVEVYISGFQYSSDQNATTENPLEYEIDEGDWRIGKPRRKVNVKEVKNSIDRRLELDNVTIHTDECGRVTPEGEQLIIGGRLAKRGELPWHTGIYRKTTTPYMQICGGSIVSTTLVISAAHCFWSDVEKLLPASGFAVAAGKLYRPWNNPYDDTQKTDVSDIKVPIRFAGREANFQDDIALLIVTKPFEYKTFVRPVCIDFDIIFDRRQLQDGKMGKVAGWGLTAENGNASQVLKVVDIPYVKIEECISESPPGFREYITSDKICAGYRNGTALCKGDSGGGLAFPDSDRGTERYYLRGIVSTAPNNENICNANALTSFTQISKHEHFIKEYLSL